MKPKLRPSDRSDVVLYFDANMPGIRECRRGCGSSGTHLCRHRFGPRIWIICDRDRLSFTRLTDLQVILDFLYLVFRYHRHGLQKKKFVIVTHDKTFLRSAQTQFVQERNMQQLPLTFGNGWADFTYGKKTVRVWVHTVDEHHGDRERDMRHVLGFARGLRAS